MSDSFEILRRKINGAADLESVVRTMKTLAASNVSQYENAVLALQDYYRAVELGLVAYMRQNEINVDHEKKGSIRASNILVFGSDQGLVGQFNERLSDFVLQTLPALPGDKNVWVVGERVYVRLHDAHLAMKKMFAVPNSVNTISPLVNQLLTNDQLISNASKNVTPFYLFYNRPVSGSVYEPTFQKLIPLDSTWRTGLNKLKWPTLNLPEIAGGTTQTLQALIREYFFVSLFKACAESLASENASRLAAMQRAEKNIDELIEKLNQNFNRLRQSSIDEELFDVISGFEAMKDKNRL